VYRRSFGTCKSVVQFLLFESFEFCLELVLDISVCSSTSDGSQSEEIIGTYLVDLIAHSYWV
jgi:hypothetical protein